MLSHMNDAHSPNRKSSSLTKDTGLQRNTTADCYMAGPHTAKTRSKQGKILFVFFLAFMSKHIHISVIVCFFWSLEKFLCFLIHKSV